MGVKAEVEKAPERGGERWYDHMGEGGSGEDEEMGGVGGDDRGEGEGEGEGGSRKGKGKGVGEDRWIEVTVDMPGQRDDDAVVVFLAQMIHEGLVADGALRTRLVINARWHWRLYIDVCTPLTFSLPIPMPPLPQTNYTLTAADFLCVYMIRSSSSPHPTPTPSPSSP